MVQMDVNSPVPINLYDDWEEAEKKADRERLSSGGLALVGRLYKQGGRYMIQSAMTFEDFVGNAMVRSKNKSQSGGDTEIFQRPEIPEHVREMQDYITSVDNYIMPPVTLNLNVGQIYTTRTQSTDRPAICLLPKGAKMAIGDGQHRYKMAERTLKDQPERLLGHSIGVNIVLEDDLAQTLQDFADCAKNRPISNSLRAKFDGRDPFNGPSEQIIKRVKLFQDRIENVGKVVAPRSIKLFTLSHLNSAFAELILGKADTTAEQYGKLVRERFDSDGEEYWINRIAWFYNTMVKYNDIWHSIATTTKDSQVPALRKNHVHLSGVGLRVISRVGHSILAFGGDDSDSKTAREELVKKLARLDYSRFNPERETTDPNREENIWRRSNVINAKGQFANSYGPVRVVTREILEYLNIPAV